jgi:hypothetical protein
MNLILGGGNGPFFARISSLKTARINRGLIFFSVPRRFA